MATTYYGQFDIAAMMDGGFYLKKGDPFRLPMDPEVEYRLIDIDAEKATISYKNKGDKEVKFEIKLKR